MATFFHGNSEIQAADGLQTLVLMNPGLIQYSDTPPHGTNLVFLNSSHTNNSLDPQNLSHAPPAHMQQFVGIPFQTAASQDPNDPQPHPQLDVAALHGFAPRMQYNLWNSIDPGAAARDDTPRAQQGLSLSLSSQQAGYGSFPVDSEVASQPQGPLISGDGVRVSGGSSFANGVSGMQSVLPLSSKYLKITQELLDEVVNVNSGNFESKTEFGKKTTSAQNKVMGESSTAPSGDGSIGGEASVKPCSELSTEERQEIQMKKTKLVNMLDEVEQRYRQYQHQMLIVISSFEQAAGIGSARSYTACAQQTISKQFRCLKDAITGQIKACNKSLGEEDCLIRGRMEGSRLKFVDNHFRQQQALQQLGMIQHDAWRPHRGLPERSVSVLRAWLFEHFLHPYPKDSDKHMLAKQTGLTRSQVSNWFINARVRLWKPMVEEMYLEEMKELEQNGSEDKTSKSSEDVTPKYNPPQDKIGGTDNQPRIFNPKHDSSINQNSPTARSVSKASTSTSPVAGNARNQSGFSLIGSSEFDWITQGSPKKTRKHEILHSSNDADGNSMSIKFGDERQSRDGYSFMGNQSNFIAGFGQYPIGEIGRFDAEQFTPSFSGNGVSLTLGLPHCENLPLSGAHQTFLSNQNMQLGRRVDMSEPNEFGAMSTSAAHSSSIYENMNLQNPKRFAAQPLPDFVA